MIIFTIFLGHQNPGPDNKILDSLLHFYIKICIEAYICIGRAFCKVHFSYSNSSKADQKGNAFLVLKSFNCRERFLTAWNSNRIKKPIVLPSWVGRVRTEPESRFRLSDPFATLFFSTLEKFAFSLWHAVIKFEVFPTWSCKTVYQNRC